MIVPPAPGNLSTGPVLEQRRDKERAVIVQDVLTLSPQFAVHAGLRRVQVKRETLGVQFVDTGFTLPSLSLVYTLRPPTGCSTRPRPTAWSTAAPPRCRRRTRTSRWNRAARSRSNWASRASSTTACRCRARCSRSRRASSTRTSPTPTCAAHEQTHRGLELSAQGNATRDLKYSLSLLALHMQQSGTGQADVDNKRTTNVPAFKSTAVLEYAVPSVAGLKVNGTWHYSGKKAFDAQNTLFVPGYHVFDLGSAYGMTVAKLQDHAARQRRQRDRQVLLA
ncbi:TonB-dependent receptor [Massilia sp. H-1]|nr:TonB-dependent receptor [Massilia sp. H-1]